MSTLSKELVFLILQFFEEESFKQTAHMLERESGLYFDMKFFEDMVLDGSWDEVEQYLSGFTKVDDNRFSTKIYFDIRKQNFLEALDNNDRAKALDILMKDLKVFAPGNEDLFKEMTQLLTLENIREHDLLSTYGDANSARKIMMCELKRVIEANPLFRGKLKFPSIKSQRLRRLINQSLNWQHLHCTYPQPNPDIKTLFVDHVCQPQHNPLFDQLTENNQPHSQATTMPNPTSPVSLISSPSTVTHPAVSSGGVCLGGPTNQATSIDGLLDSHIMSQKRPIGTSDEVTSTVTYPGQSHSFNMPDDLPKIPIKNDTYISCGQSRNDDLPKAVARILNEGSSPMSMDFHPVQQTFLLVGTIIGDIGLWEVNSGEKLLSRNFKVWDVGACSMMFKAALVKDPCVSINRVIWSPDGFLFGVAYSKHILQLYSYHGGNNVQQQLEIDAHVGGVNDLAFSAPDKKLLVISCGDDKTIKVWDVVSGVKMYSFEGHDAPVYSLCPQTKESVHFIFSTSVDGKIKAWLYDNFGERIDYDAPGHGHTTMAYSADDIRLFSCGTSKDGDSFLVEWDESEGSIKRTYQGLQRNSLAVVQFDTTKNQFLAAGDDYMIKFWEMDKVELLTTIDADGGLPANPHIRFNKEGTLLAVFANENKIKILATDCDLSLLRTSENHSVDASRVLSDSLKKLTINPNSTVAGSDIADGSGLLNGDQKNVIDVKSSFTGETSNKSKIWKTFQIDRPSQCQSLQLPAHVKANKISRLIYTNSGNAILALASNGNHLLWKWPQNDLNLSGKATTKVPPQLWQPRTCSQLMTNDLTGANLEEYVPCFVLSKNDSYLMSASGGIISLFNMLTFKTMMTMMPPSPAATCLSFHPKDNNIIAIGMDDSSILIYHVRLAKVKSKLEGHSERVTGLAFSNALNVLVSSGADAQIFVWNADKWEKQRSRFLQTPSEKISTVLYDTRIQFHQDQTHFLVVHDTHLAIYETEQLECVKQWVSADSTPISQATFSCDNQMVYASFVDGTMSIFNASNLELHCRIISSAYLPPSTSFNVYPLCIAAHPQIPTQFAVGLTDGGVYVFEPRNAGGKWRMLPPDENVSASSMLVVSDLDDLELIKPRVD